MKDSSLNEDLSVAVPSVARQPRSIRSTTRPVRGLPNFRASPGPKSNASGSGSRLREREFETVPERTQRFGDAVDFGRMPKVREAMHFPAADAQPTGKLGRAADLKNTNDRTFERLSARLGNRNKAYSKRPTPLHPLGNPPASPGRYGERRDVPDLDRRKRVRYKCAEHVRRRAAAAAFERARRKKTESRAARRFGKGAKNGQNER